MTQGLTIGVLGDLHLATEPYPPSSWHNSYDFGGLVERVDAAMSAFAVARVDAICLIGDLTHTGSPAPLPPLASRLADLAVPVLVASGNHDRGDQALRAALPKAELAPHWGRSLGGWRLAALQIRLGPIFGAKLQSVPVVEQWAREPVVLLSHFPICSFAESFAERGMPYPGDFIGREAVRQSLTLRSAPTVVMSGHLHARASKCDGPMLQLVQGSLVEAPYECSVLEIEPSRITRRALELQGPRIDGRAPALADPVETFVLLDDCWRAVAPSADQERSTTAPSA